MATAFSLTTVGSLAAFALGACASGFAGAVGPSDVLRPLPPQVFWAGLPPAAASAAASGTVPLCDRRVDGRILIPGGRSTTGVDQEGLRLIGALCQHEPLGMRCDDEHLKRHFLAEVAAHRVTLSSYAIDRTEVTVAAYGRCVAAGECPPPDCGAGDPRFDQPDLPVTFVDWDAASRLLPVGRREAPDGGRVGVRGARRGGANVPVGQRLQPLPLTTGRCRRATRRTERTGSWAWRRSGSFPDGATPLGVLDLAGNAAEWVSDFFDVDPRGVGFAPGPVTNPTGPKTGSVHVVRGGDFEDGAPFMRAASRNDSAGASPTVGFRCVADEGSHRCESRTSPTCTCFRSRAWVRCGFSTSGSPATPT